MYRIYIQCIKDLGIFLEIEFNNDSSKNIDDDSIVNKLITFAKSFNLKLGNDYKARKAELLYINYTLNINLRIIT